MIGYDGRVYEGRGWNVKSHISEYNPEYRERSIDIGILGSDNSKSSIILGSDNSKSSIILLLNTFMGITKLALYRVFKW